MILVVLISHGENCDTSCVFPLQGTFPMPPAPVSPSEDFARLLRDAAEGLPVAGRVPTWEADRPKTLAVGEPVKVRFT